MSISALHYLIWELQECVSKRSSWCTLVIFVLLVPQRVSQAQVSDMAYLESFQLGESVQSHGMYNAPHLPSQSVEIGSGRDNTLHRLTWAARRYAA